MVKYSVKFVPYFPWSPLRVRAFRRFATVGTDSRIILLVHAIIVPDLNSGKKAERMLFSSAKIKMLTTDNCIMEIIKGRSLAFSEPPYYENLLMEGTFL